MRILCPQSQIRTLIFAALLLLGAPAPAHSQAPYIYASIPSGGTTSQIVGFSVGVDGTLTRLTGSPFSVSGEGGFVTTDPTDQFLFVLNAASNTISVLSIDSSGALTEVPGSPVPSPPPAGGGSAPSAPIRMATFKGASANYLYVAYTNGPLPYGAIVAFQIGTPSQNPPLSPISTMTFEAAPVDLAITPQNNPQGFLYVAFQLVPDSTLGSQTPGTAVFTIDATSGQLSQPTFIDSNVHDDSLALNSRATVLFEGEGSSAAGLIESAQIRSDGTTLAPQSVPVVHPNSPPSTLLPDGTGHLLYVQQGAQPAVFTIDQTTGGLSVPPLSAAPLAFDLKPGMTVADPVEPYLYILQSDQIHIFEITDITSGTLRELVSSPVTLIESAGSVGLALTHNAINQAAPPDAAQLVPAAINFNDTTIGQSASNNSPLLTNTGTEPLNVVVTISGADQNDFTTTTCASPVAPQTSCSITVTFAPTLAGARQATLVVADSVGPQTLQLTGNGLAAQPAVSLSPSSLTFASTTTGVTSASQSVVLTNSGSTNLHISSILVGGQNSADFVITNSPSPSTLPPACTTAAYAPNSSCTITIVFTPLATGARNASITISDDAPGSTQAVPLAGTGLAASTGGTGNPTPTGSPAILVSASALTFISTAINATTTEQDIIVSNTGASGSSLTITGVHITGQDLADFNVVNGCTASVSPQTQGCPLIVTFTPSAFGTRTASLVFTDNASPSTETVTLTGTTQNGSAVLTINYPTGTTQSVSAGGTATFSLSLVSNFSGTVVFSPCVGAPATATCTVQPASIAVVPNTATTPVAFQVIVATAAATSSLGYDKLDRREITLLNLVRLSSIATCSLFFVFLYRRRWRCARLLHAPGFNSFAFSRSANVTLATIVATCALTFAGCGGASTIATAPVATPAPTATSQTYTITITPSATTSSNIVIPALQPIQLTLNLD
jgi:Abnormal spindle-like microcephaly-assoc'd, ASPM-SPD-2-Hydin